MKKKTYIDFFSLSLAECQKKKSKLRNITNTLLPLRMTTKINLQLHGKIMLSMQESASKYILDDF